MNIQTITGNLTADPERVTYTAGEEQRSLTKFRIANTEGANTNRERTSFFDVVAFGPQGQHVATSLKKGDRVVVIGELVQRSWERDDGTRGYRIQMNAVAVGASLEFHQVTINHQNRKENAA
jgi:single-strand DNA-binding protein